jgi:DNA-binding transcriptional LysR family regulator
MDSPPIAIELRSLRYFLAVSEELHFHRAAERLHMAQPPLSHAIRKLEDVLGVRLFERTSRVVGLTEAGRVFAESVREVLSTLDLAVAESRRAGGVGSPLRIGYFPWLPVARLQGFLDRVRQRDPNSSPQPRELPPAEQRELLSRWELDFGILPRSEDSAALESEPLFPGEQLAVVLPSGHRLTTKRIVSPEDLAEEVLVLGPGQQLNPGLRRYMLDQINGAGYRFRGMREAGGATPRDLVLAVAGGLGVSFAPLSIDEVNPTETLVVSRPLDSALSMPETVLAWHASPPPQLRAVIAAIREIARELRQVTDGEHEPTES